MSSKPKVAGVGSTSATKPTVSGTKPKVQASKGLPVPKKLASKTNPGAAKPPPPSKPAALRAGKAKVAGSKPKASTANKPQPSTNKPKVAAAKPKVSTTKGSPTKSSPKKTPVKASPSKGTGQPKPALGKKPQLPVKPKSLSRPGSQVGSPDKAVLSQTKVKPSVKTEPVVAEPAPAEEHVPEPQSEVQPPQLESEPVQAPEPAQEVVPEPIQVQEPEQVPEPVQEPEPVQVAEAEKPEPVEPIPEPVSEPAMEPEPVQEPVQPEPVQEPEASSPPKQPPQPPKRTTPVRVTPSQPVAPAAPTVTVENVPLRNKGSPDRVNLGLSVLGESETDAAQALEQKREWRKSAQFNQQKEVSTEQLATSFQAKALFDFEAQDAEELDFKAGDIITVTESSDDVWWLGEHNGNCAYFPSEFVVKLARPTSTNPFAADTAQEPEPVRLLDQPLYGNDPQPSVMFAEPAVEPVAEPLYGNTPGNPFDVPGSIAAASASAAADQTEEDLAPPLFGRALYAYESTSDSELSLKPGDVLEVLSCEEGDAWWSGAIDDREGWFPSSYVELLDEFTVQNLINEYDEDSGDEELEEVSTNKARSHVVSEILSTEQDYLDNLEMVIRGYMMPMRPRVGDLFNDSTMSMIFSNLEQIQNHHARFIADLTAAGPNVGSCFVKHADSFKIYSVYCANHPRAARELSAILDHDLQIQSFFEGCRLLVEKDIALEGFLLKPVQRICQYPLLLKELVKVTPETHSDYANTTAALDQMKEMAQAINEDKRHKEELMQLQKSIEGWDGPDITDTCTQLIMDGILTKISGSKSQDRHFFLFDNLFIYCKRTLKGSLQVKGKIATDNFTVIDLKDGEEKHGSKPLKYAFKINNEAKKKWYILCARSEEEKDCWLDGFLAERQKVQEDWAAGMRNVTVTLDEDAKNRQQQQNLRRKALQKRFGGQTLRRGPKRRAKPK